MTAIVQRFSICEGIYPLNDNDNDKENEMAKPRSRMPYLERESTLTDWRIKRSITECDLAAACGCSQQVISGASFGKTPPVFVAGPNKGETKPWATRMAEELNVPLTELFPRYFCALTPTEDNAHLDDVTEGSISQATIAAACCWGGSSMDKVKLNDAIVNVFVTLLNYKQYRVVFLRHFEGHTLEESGELLGVTKQRAKQLENEAFKKIRHSQCLPALVLKQLHEEK